MNTDPQQPDAKGPNAMTTTTTEPAEPITVAALNQALNAAATEQLNALAGSGCPRLVWTVDPAARCTIRLSGQAGADHSPTEVPDVLTAWAHRLGLQPDPDAVEGTTGYRGYLGSFEIEVWGVTDTATFYAMADALPRS